MKHLCSIRLSLIALVALYFCFPCSSYRMFVLNQQSNKLNCPVRLQENSNQPAGKEKKDGTFLWRSLVFAMSFIQFSQSTLPPANALNINLESITAPAKTSIVSLMSSLNDDATTVKDINWKPSLDDIVSNIKNFRAPSESKLLTTTVRNLDESTPKSIVTAHPIKNAVEYLSNAPFSLNIEKLSPVNPDAIKSSLTDWRLGLGFTGALVLFADRIQYGNELKKLTEQQEQTISRLNEEIVGLSSAIACENSCNYTMLLSETSELRQEVERMTSLFDEKCQEVVDLNETLQSLMNDVNDNTHVEAFKEEISHLQNQIALYEKAALTLPTTITSSSSSNSEKVLMSKLQETEEVLRLARERDAKLIQSLKRFFVETGLISPGVSNMLLMATAPGMIEDALKKMKATDGMKVAAERVNELEMELETMKQSLHEKDQQMKEKIGLLEKWEGEKRRMMKEMEEMKQSMGVMEKDSVGKTKKVMELEEKLLQSSEEMKKLKMEIGKEKDSEMAAMRTAFDLERKSQASELVAKEAMLSGLTKEKESLVLNGITFKKELEKATEEIVQLKASMKELMEGNERWREALEKAEAANVSKAMEVQSRGAEKEFEMKRLETELSELKETVKELKVRNEMLELKVAEGGGSKVQGDVLSVGGADSMKQVNELESKLEAAKIMTKELSSRLAAKETELKQKNAEIVKLTKDEDKGKSIANGADNAESIPDAGVVTAKKGKASPRKKSTPPIVAPVEQAISPVEVVERVEEVVAVTTKPTEPMKPFEEMKHSDDAVMNELKQLKPYQIKAMNKTELIQRLVKFNVQGDLESRTKAELLKELQSILESS